MVRTHKQRPNYVIFRLFKVIPVIRVFFLQKKQHSRI